MERRNRYFLHMNKFKLKKCLAFQGTGKANVAKLKQKDHVDKTSTGENEKGKLGRCEGIPRDAEAKRRQFESKLRKQMTLDLQTIEMN